MDGLSFTINKWAGFGIGNDYPVIANQKIDYPIIRL